MSFGLLFSVFFGSVSFKSAKHIAVQQVADPTEHFFRFSVFPTGNDFPDAFFNFFIVGHYVSLIALLSVTSLIAYLYEQED